MSTRQPSQVHTLALPITIGGATITRVTIHRPKIRHLRAMRDGVRGNEAADQLDQSVALIAALSDLPEGAVEELDLEDFEAISALIEGFMPGRQGPETGAPSSPKPPTG